MSGRPKVFGNLMAEVIRKDRCVSCGACLAVCPVKSIVLEEGKPKLVGLCVACSMCYNNCPRAEFDVEDMEKQIFGRIRTEEESEVGIIKACYAVRAKEAETLEHCQDGGAVTAILTQFLNDGGDCAVVANLEEGRVWAPKPFVALSREDIIDGAGTKYTPSPTLVGVDSAINEYVKSKIAVVGTPCQIRALRRIENEPYSYENIKDAVALKLGLFCMETFDYSSFIDFLKKEGVDASEVTKFDIKKGRFIAWKDEESLYNVKLSKVKELVRPCCGHCDDFASEFSDLAIGNVGSPDGWSTVIVRTETGENALRAAEKSNLLEVQPLENVKPGLGMINRLARLKKKEAKA